jgi:hypothetical protein
MADHCWDPILDHGGAIPVCVPLDPTATPFRIMQVTREEQLAVHYKCCWCGTRATRRFKIAKDAAHGPHHASFKFPESDPLPSGTCSGARPS